MRIKIIGAEFISDLENRVNAFLRDVDDKQIVDIKYQGVGCHTVNGINRPSVMIILR